MKLLLTSGGLTNTTIVDALRDLLGKPFNESRVVFVPTAANAERGDKGWLVKDYQKTTELGWREFEIIDIATIAGLPEELWLPALKQADVIVFGGGNSFYLSYWLEKSGVGELLPGLLTKGAVFVGVSAGSMVAGKNLRAASQALDHVNIMENQEYDELGPAKQSSAQTLGFTEFVFRAHLNSDDFPKIRDSFLQKMAKNMDAPMYALDDDSAIKIDGDNLQVVSEGEWKYYT